MYEPLPPAPNPYEELAGPPAGAAAGGLAGFGAGGIAPGIVGGFAHGLAAGSASGALTRAGAATGGVLLAALCFSHFFIDFCLGVTAPMIPTLMRQFSLTKLGGVAAIVTVIPLVANFSQPPIGLMMRRFRTPVIMLLCPLLSGASLWVGFAQSRWEAALLFLLSGLAIGAYHPFAFVMANRALPGRPSLSTAIFVSFGFLGVSTGSMVSGRWLERYGFAGFQWLYFMGAAVVVVLALARVHRASLSDHMGAPAAPRDEMEATHSRLREAVRFKVVWWVGLTLAFQTGVLQFLTPTLFKELYGSEGSGGDASFVLGLAGGLSSYLYAHLADRGNPFRVALLAEMAALIPMAGFFFWADSVGGRTAMIGLIGLTAGGVFPLIASLSRTARGLNVGLRSSLILGGVWGVAALINLGLAKLTDYGFTLEYVMRSIMLGPILIAPLLWISARRYES